MWHEQQALANVIPDTIFYGPGFIYNNNRLPSIIKEVYGSGRPDIIICHISGRALLGEPLPKKIVERYNVPKSLQRFPLDMDKVKIPKIFQMWDVWHCSGNEWRKIILKHGFYAIFTGLYPPFFPKGIFDEYFDSDIQDYLYIQPLLGAANPQVFKDYGFSKEYDVMLFGRLGSNFYPLRTYFDKILKAQTDIKYYSERNPPYLFYEKDEDAGVPIRANYAKAINRSRIFLTCCARYKNPILKVFEALACKTLLMCDRPMGAEEIGLVDGETYVEVDQDNFLEKIRYYLRRPDEIKRISENGHRLFLARHTVEKRAAEFKELIEKVISKGYLIKTKMKSSYGFFNHLKDLKDKYLHKNV